MKVVLFYHSVLSDWNHGNAHFLRGVTGELIRRGHDAVVYEERNAWSVENLLRDHGPRPLDGFHRRYPDIPYVRYDFERLDLERALDSADLVLVHEWNRPELVARLGERRARSRGFRLLFHDTHHRLVTRPEEIRRFDLRHYDGVLAFGKVLAELYRSAGITGRSWVWHEAADTTLFRPVPMEPKLWDLLWVGNWGDGERSAELDEFLFSPIAELGLRAAIHGVRYPEHAVRSIEDRGIAFGGWLPNYRVPEALASARATVHVPRRPYAEALPGIPTIRVFEALACGTPLVCAPWADSEGLFRPGKDYLVASNGAQMRGHLRDILNDMDLARMLSRNAVETVRSRHTCSHRVDELLAVHAELSSRSKEAVA